MSDSNEAGSWSIGRAPRTEPPHRVKMFLRGGLAPIRLSPAETEELLSALFKITDLSVPEAVEATFQAFELMSGGPAPERLPAGCFPAHVVLALSEAVAAEMTR